MIRGRKQKDRSPERQRPDPSGFASLKLELVVMTMALVLVMSGTMGLTVAWIYSRALGEGQVEAGTALAGGAALSLSLSDDWGAFPWPLLENITAEAGLQLVMATDAKGHFLRRGSVPILPRDETALRATLATGSPQAAFDGQLFSVAAPILRRNLLAGAICFSGATAGLGAAGSRAQTWMLAALGVNIVLMGGFLVFFLNRRLLTPLKELARNLADLGGDRFHPQARPPAPREMGELFKAFDLAALELMESRRLLEEQLRTIRETRDYLVASEKMATVGRLASGLAHELGNPIGALIGFVHLLRRDDLSPEDKTKILDHSAHELARMDGSLKELLHFSRPGRRSREPVDVAEVAGAAVSLAQPQKWAAGVEMTCETSGGATLVMAERNSLLQVFLNLLANAGQALAQTAEPRIRVVIQPPDQAGLIRIMVRDNGPGVTPEDALHIFEPYFTRKEPGQGTGLGLAISQSIINDFNGRLEYSPAETQGAVFTAILPAAPPERS
jgi:signal transduction histidine kinase